MLRLDRRAPANAEPELSLSLTHEQRARSRFRAHADSGEALAVILDAGDGLEDGDRLRGDEGRVVEIRAAAEPVTTLSPANPLALARLAYHLGNRHVPLEIGDGWLRYQPDHVLDEMVRAFGASPQHHHAPFAPEKGAYHSHASHGHRTHTHEAQESVDE